MQDTFGRSKTQLSQRIVSLCSRQRLILTIVCFGIIVRLVQYLFNRSLWADEAVLALNIVNRSYLELLEPLDYEQGAPIGFLMVEKLAVQVFGDNEYALRLFPLLSSIIAFLLFYDLAVRCIQRSAIPIALVLFASLRYLVYFASEVKQYSSDVAIALLSCLIARHLRSSKLGVSQIVAFSLLGAFAIWFSHPAVFVLAGVGITSLIELFKKARAKVIGVLVVYSTWILSFALLYFISLRNLGGSEELLKSWQNKGGFPLSAFATPLWLLDSFGRFFHNPLGFTGVLDGLALIAFLAGCISCFYRNKEVLFILLSPLFVTFLAAYLQKYPFSNRLVLFLTPFIILLIAEGVTYIITRKSKPTVIVGIVIGVLLLAQPLVRASNLLVKPYLREEIKSVIGYVKTHQQPKDVLYVFQRGEYQFKYYAEKYGYKDGDYIIGVDDLDKYDGKKVSAAELERYRSDLDKLRGNKRVWLIFSHAYLWKENNMIQSHLNSIGKQIDVFTSPGSFVYLYDLSYN